MAGKKKVIEHPAAELPRVKILPIPLSADTLQRRGVQTRKPPYNDPVIDRRLPDGTIPSDMLDKDIIVKVLAWQGADKQFDKVELMVDGVLTGIIEPIVEPPDFTELTLTPALIPNERRYVIDYMTWQAIGNNAEPAEAPIPVIVDRTPPGSADLGAMSFAIEHLDGVTPGELDNNDELITVLPGWYDEATGDVATLFYSTDENPTDSDYLAFNPNLSLTVGDPNDHYEIGIPKASLVAMGDGDRWFSYQIRDQAGNVRSALAPGVRLKILMNAPSTLAAPLVPANDDGLITWADAAPGFQPDGLPVQIPRYTDPAPQDQILVYWGNSAIGLTGEIGTPPGGTWNDPMMAIGVPFTYVNNGSTWPATVDVTYSVLRASVQIPRSAATTVQVNLTTPGGIVDPEPGTPVHENLRPLEVLSSGGSSNMIPADEYGNDATAIIPYTGADTSPIWAAGDTLAVTWGSRTVTRPIEATDTSDISFTVDHASVIGVSPSGEVPVSYSIRRVLAGSAIGEALSPATPVQVVNTASLPGGTAGLPLALYPEAFQSGQYLVINRAAGADGTKIRVPLIDGAGTPLANVSAGNTVNVRFVAVNSRTDSNAAEIPATEVKRNHTLEAADLTAGYWEADITEDELKAICYLTANAYITITNAVGPAVSAKSPVVISVRVEGYCTVPTLP